MNTNDNTSEINSLFPPGRKLLRVSEVALILRVADQHILDLVDEGQLRAIDLSGANNLSRRRCMRIPVGSLVTYLHRRSQ